jgi:hypothetical protein
LVGNTCLILMVQVFYTEKHQIKTPLYECRIIVEERWVDNEGNIYYKALLLFDTIPFDKPVRKERWLIKIWISYLRISG